MLFDVFYDDYLPLITVDDNMNTPEKPKPTDSEKSGSNLKKKSDVAQEATEGKHKDTDEEKGPPAARILTYSQQGEYLYIIMRMLLIYY